MAGGVSLSPIIQKMLFGMGDIKEPNEDTCHIIEQHLKEQLDFIVFKAYEIDPYCREITIRNIIYQMRDNPGRLLRVYEYFHAKCGKRESSGKTKGAGLITLATTQKDLEADLNACSSGTNYENVLRQILDFTEEFKINVFLAAVDIPNERKLQLYRRYLMLSKEDQQLFQESCGVSFTSGNDKDLFDEWLQLKLHYNPGVSLMTSTCHELIRFLAKEIIDQIIDHVFIMRSSGHLQYLSSSALTKKTTPFYPIMPEEINKVVRQYCSKFCIIF